MSELPHIHSHYEALERVGLPVTCGACGEKGFIKPNTEHGWYRRKSLNGKPRWYCPRDGAPLKKLLERVTDSFATPEPVVDNTEDILNELDNLLGED